MTAQATCPQCRQPALGAAEPCPACGFVPRAAEPAGQLRRSAALWAAVDLALVAAVLICPWFYAPQPVLRQVFVSNLGVELAGTADILVNERQELLVGETIQISVPQAVAQMFQSGAPPASVRVRAERGALLENVLQVAAELARAGVPQVSVELPAP